MALQMLATVKLGLATVKLGLATVKLGLATWIALRAC
ncbi:hypothetical protein OKW42_003406 [Paraburkholderia sp. WC7.3d]